MRDGEAQNFNWIATGKDKVDLQVLLWDSDRIEADSAIGFRFDGENWRSAVPAETGLPTGPAYQKRLPTTQARSFGIPPRPFSM